MNPASQDIKDILVDGGLGTFATDLFIGTAPTKPDTVIVISDTGGEEADAIADSSNYERPTIQVMVRGKKNGYRAAYTIADSVKNLLHATGNFVRNGTYYAGIWCVSDILSLGADDAGRELFTVNFRIQRYSNS